MFYAIQWTWGLLENLIGLIVYLALSKHERFRYGKAFGTRIPMSWGGNFSLGMFIFVCPNQPQEIYQHELGHCYQNNIFGILKPFLVSIPSVFRFYVLGGRYMTQEKYLSVWFEGQASELGKKKYEENQKTTEKK